MLSFLTAVTPLLDRVLGSFLPDPNKRQEVIAQILSQFQQLDLSQMGINLADAQSGNAWQAGWRPAIGWIFASALAIQYVISPLAAWAASVFFQYTLPPIVKFDEMLWELMFGMLGMGALRSFEKAKGLTK